jgi:streptogramin lyase
VFNRNDQLNAQSFTVFPLPKVGSRPLGIAAGPDGNLWAAEYDANQIARITPSGTVTVRIAPGDAPLDACLGGDANHDGMISVYEILAAVTAVVGNCSPLKRSKCVDRLLKRRAR